jgi:hypothetical protein
VWQPRLASLVRALRVRRRQVQWAVLLGAAGAALLVIGKDTTGYGQDILVNVGASLVMVALSFVVFDPVFEDLRKNAVEEHRTLDHDQLIVHIAAAQTEVDILETWTGLLEESHRDRFLGAVQAALQQGVDVRVLLLDPDSAAAEQRAEELHHAQVPLLIMDNLRYLYRLRRDLDARLARQLQVRVYDASPSVQLYRWDDKALISFFPVGVRAYDARQIEAYMDSPLGQFMESRFDELWSSTTTRTIDDFMALAVTVRLGDAALATSEAHFVRLGDDCFVDGRSLLDHLADHGAHQLRVATARPLEVGEWRGSSFGMVRLDHRDRPLRAAVVQLFDAKYGPGHERSVILRLVPQVQPAPGGSERGQTLAH